MTHAAPKDRAPAEGFVKGLGLFDSTMLVAGSMIGSGIFIVSADIARHVGSPGWLLATWVITGLLTLAAALCYGELAGMMPKVGGQYVYLREAYSPLFGFLYGWTMFLVIQTGTIAAVAIAFARFLGVLVPGVSSTWWIVPPIDLSDGYAISLSSQQLVGIVMIVVLTFINTRGLSLGKIIQNVFTFTKTAALVGLILLALLIGWQADAISANFGGGIAGGSAGGSAGGLAGSWSGFWEAFWTPRGEATIQPDLGFLSPTSASAGVLGLFVALCVAQVGSLFACDAWNNVTFVAAEVRDARRTIMRAMVFGAILVLGLYLLANVAYVVTLPLDGIQHAPDDRVGTAALAAIVGPAGATIMAIFILVSTFGCNNGLVLVGARVYYAMAQDGLFFRAVGRLNKHHVPAVGLVLQGIVSCLLVLPRTRTVDAETGAVEYGNLYSNLLDYVVFAVLIFYVLTIGGLFVLRRKRPDAERPYRAFGYPIVPALYIVCAVAIMVVLVLYKTQTTWPGLVIVLSGIPAWMIWRRSARA